MNDRKARLLTKIARKSKALAKEGQSGLAGDPLDFEAAERYVAIPAYDKEIAKAKPQPTPAKPQAPTPTTPPIPKEVLAALTSNPATEGYRGSLLVQVDGMNVGVSFNRDREMDEAEEIKQNIQHALPKYRVSVVGFDHPNWKANF